MTKNYGAPDRRSVSRSVGRRDKNLPPLPLTPKVPASKLPVPPATSGEALPRSRPIPPLGKSQNDQGTQGSKDLIQRSHPSVKAPSTKAPSAQASQSAIPTTARRKHPRKPFRLPTSWQFWAILAVLASTGIGLFSVALLLRLPALPNCPKIFWPTASASLRMYCAEVAANKQTVDNLLEAIALVNDLPPDHPLRPEIDRLIEQWSQEVLDLGEEAFQAGKLSEAIAIALRVPTNTPAYGLVEEQIDSWQSIWAEAEKIYQDAEAELRKQNWRQAFANAVRLLTVKNTYWETTKYQELNNKISTARQDSNKLTKAQSQARKGGVTNLLAAIKLAEEIGPNSYVYEEAQKAIADFGRKMIDLAQATLDRRNAQEALSIVRKIPASAKLQAEIRDFTTLAQAQEKAWGGTVADLQEAIGRAQELDSNRPLYGKARQLISRWQLEIEDVTHLEMARQLAQPGTVGDLTAAIAEAELIPRSNPRWDEAQREIDRWTRQVETSEDRPYLDRANQIAAAGDVASLQMAINEASQITEGRALYSEARGKIREWSRIIQSTQDQPYLDRARELANLGDLPSAIASAQQIGSGRALYEEAQTEIRRWRRQVQSQENMQLAYRLAASGTPDALAEAIRVADQVADSSSLRAEANNVINSWSQQLLGIAQNQAQYDPSGAIAIAERIPTRTEAYAEAQLQIQAWRESLEAEPE